MSRVIRFIGDVHAKFDEYVKILPDDDRVLSYQVGDFGIGFATPPDTQVKRTHCDWFIRGNHDNPALCSEHEGYIPDGLYNPFYDVMFVGGAESVDRHMRTEGLDWWADEQLSIERLGDFTERYIAEEPSIMVTHDAPDPICAYVLGFHPYHLSRTQQALGAMWSFHKPKLWVFGHYHKHFDQVYEGTRFLCLPELAYADIDIDEYMKR